MVLVYHLMLFNGASGHRWTDALAQLRGLGWMGVDLFFVLSGFLITGILYDTVHQVYFFRNFYMRRFLRIFPLYYGFLFLLLALTPWLHVIWGGRQFLLLAYLQNTTVGFSAKGLYLSAFINLNHFWSLAVEEQFYLFWPFLVFWEKDRRRLIQLSLVLSAGALALRLWIAHLNLIALSSSDWLIPFHVAISRILQKSVLYGFMNRFPLCRIDSLLIGGSLALWLRGEKTICAQKKYEWLALGFLGITTVLMTVIALVNPHQSLMRIQFVATFGYSMIAIAFSSLVYLAIQSGSMWNRFFCIAWLRNLGKYSYGIYVLHISIAYLFRISARRFLGESLQSFLEAGIHSYELAGIIEFALTVSVVYCAAWLSYNFYEVYFLRLKKYFQYTEN